MNAIDWKTVFKNAGAFAAYQIGAGFASGQEIMQYYCTWGWLWVFILPVFVYIWNCIFLVSNYTVGMREQFENPNEIFGYYTTPKIGKIMDTFVNASIALMSLVMFSGAGATINQYFGIPIWVGTLAVGGVAAFVVCMGLEKVADVLGSCGILIIVFMVIIFAYSLFVSENTVLEGQARIAEYVNDGIFLQSTAFGIENPVLSGISIGGVGIALSMVFNGSLGAKIKNKQTCIASAFMAALFYIMGVVFVSMPMLQHLDYIASIEAKVPMMAAVTQILPIMTFPYCIIIIIASFTTIAGYLWICGRRVAPDKTLKQRVVVIAISAVGITIGSIIPLDILVNLMFQITGYIGIVCFACLLRSFVKSPQKTAS